MRLEAARQRRRTLTFAARVRAGASTAAARTAAIAGDDWRLSGRWSAAFALALLLHLPFLRLDAYIPDDVQWLAGPGRGAGSDAVSVYELYLVTPRARAAEIAAATTAIVVPQTGAPGKVAVAAEANSETAPAPPPAADVREAGGGGRDSYYARLRAHLQRHRRPVQGATAGARTVVVRFRVDIEGGVAAVTLQRGSGDPRLDAEALDLVRRAAPVPAPPRALNLAVPVEFE